MLGLVYKKFPAYPAIVVSALAGAVLAVLFQPDTVAKLAGDTAGLNAPFVMLKGVWISLFDGYTSNSGNEFLDALRERTQVIILSDTFEQFAAPFMAQLGWPTIMCHQLLVDGDRIVGYQLRQQDQKRKAVHAFQSLNFKILAAGDSYNDTTMLGAASTGFLFRSPDNVIAEFPQFRSFTEFDDLLAAFTAEL